MYYHDRQASRLVSGPNPRAAATSGTFGMKRIVVLCDGTWQRPDGRYASNVVHMARCVLPRSSDGVEQIVYYQEGLGSNGGVDALNAGAFGRGIDAEIQRLYRFLVHNYRDGDELFFFGFSRGAYTVRSTIGMLRNAWLLHKAHAGMIPRAYHIYRTRWGPDADNAVRFREPHCRAVRVRFLGVWDTVGALGIPIALFDGLNEERYGFHDTTISRIVEHACHALAIDERRKPFAPTVWKTRSDRKRTEQAWFSGSHSDIGGGHREAGLSLISLQWIASQAAQAGLALDQTLLDHVMSRNNREVVHDTVPLPYRIFGTAERAIGITNPDEILHPSAEQRFLREPDYRPRNLVEYLARDEQIRLPI